MNYCPTEFQEQKTLKVYLDMLMAQKKIVAYTAIPQNTWTRSWQQKMKAKLEGVQPGFPDMVVVGLNGVYFIEMKRVKGGRLRPEQKDWLRHLAMKQTKSICCYGFDQAKEWLDMVLKLDK